MVHTPTTGDITAVRLALQATGHASTSGVIWQWRRGETDTFTDIPAGDITLAEGGGAITWPVATTGGGAYPKLTWNVEQSLNNAEPGPEALDGPLQLRAFFTGTGQGPSEPARITFDRNRATAATATVGPGQVNLLTGNLTVAGADVDVFGLALARVFNTRRASEPDVMFGPGWVSSAIVADAASGYTALTVVGSLVQIGLPDDSVIGFTQHDATNATFDPQVGMPSAVGHDDPPSPGPAHDRRGGGRVGPPGAVVDLANTMKWSPEGGDRHRAQQAGASA